MQLYDLNQKTTIDPSPVLQLKIDFDNTDIVEGSGQPCTCSINISVTNAVITLTTVATDFKGVSYHKTVSLTHPDLSHVYFVDVDHNPLKTSDDELFMVRKVNDAADMDSLIVVNTSMFYCLLDASDLQEGYNETFSVYLFNVKFPNTSVALYTHLNGEPLVPGGALPTIDGYSWVVEGGNLAGYQLVLTCNVEPSKITQQINPYNGDYILSINGKSTPSGNFSAQYDLNTEDIELPKPLMTFKELANIKDVIRRIPAMKQGPFESAAALPDDLGAVANPEVLFKQLGFNADTYKELYQYGEYDMSMNDIGYFESGEEALYPVSPVRPLPSDIDTTSLEHTRISYVPFKKYDIENRIEDYTAAGIALKPRGIGSKALYSNSRNVYKSRDTGGGGKADTNSGYFKIVKIEHEDYCVCDAATLTSDRKDSGPSPIYITYMGVTDIWKYPYMAFEDLYDIVKDEEEEEGEGNKEEESSIIFLVLEVTRLDVNSFSSTIKKYDKEGDIPQPTPNIQRLIIGRVSTSGQIFQDHIGPAYFTFSSAYTGEFTIVDVSTYADEGENEEGKKQNEYRIEVRNGISEEASSYCRINNVLKSVKLTRFGSLKEGVVYHVVIDVNITELDLLGATATVGLYAEGSQELPSDTTTAVHYKIGTVIVKNNRVVISQDHKTGIPQMYWYVPCGYELPKKADTTG